MIEKKQEELKDRSTIQCMKRESKCKKKEEKEKQSEIFKEKLREKNKKEIGQIWFI